MAQTVAVLGLGTMGAGMARNLLAAGFSVRVFNRTRSRAEPLAQFGATLCSSPAEAAAGASLIVAMLSDDSASRDVWLGSGGALPAAAPGTVLLEASTLTPAWVAALSEAARQRGLQLLDAPVTGSRMQAEQAKLNFLVGGDAAALEAARPALDAMGQSITHLGPVGSGARMKLINNFLCGVQVTSLAEAMVWIERSGLDRDQALQLLKNGAPGSPLLAGISARMVDATFDVNFLLELMQKDMRYAQTDAACFGVELSTAAVAASRFDEAAAAGLGHKDMSAVIEPLRARKA